jgi:hypothetical protein
MTKAARTAAAIARVESALPAAIAHRLAGIFIPTGDDDREFLANAETVFNACTMAPVDGMPLAKRETHRRAVLKLRAELLDQYEGRGAVTVYAAAQAWFQYLADDGLVPMEEGGPFAVTWAALGESFQRDAGNMEAYAACERSALRMAGEWIGWLENRGFYRSGEAVAA